MRRTSDALRRPVSRPAGFGGFGVGTAGEGRDGCGEEADGDEGAELHSATLAGDDDLADDRSPVLRFTDKVYARAQPAHVIRTGAEVEDAAAGDR